MSKSLKRILRQGVASGPPQGLQILPIVGSCRRPALGHLHDPNPCPTYWNTHTFCLGVSSRSIWLGQTWGHPKVPKWLVRAPRKRNCAPQCIRILKSKMTKCLKRILRQGVASGPPEGFQILPIVGSCRRPALGHLHDPNPCPTYWYTHTFCLGELQIFQVGPKLGSPQGSQVVGPSAT